MPLAGARFAVDTGLRWGRLLPGQRVCSADLYNSILVVKENADDAFYELQNPQQQIQSHAFDAQRLQLMKVSTKGEAEKIHLGEEGGREAEAGTCRALHRQQRQAITTACVENILNF
ncbi:hypothetical protein ZWY2020_041405 [Hordeum vulgare]|nr:hypothetical protein ZWY2020_041405 [Hordeum vulgare]